MKNILLGIAAISSLALAAPAAAQYSSANQGQSGVNANANLSARIGQLQTRIETGVRSGAISRQEAAPLRQQLRQLTRLERRYSRNGLTRQERSDLQQRIRAVREQVRTADGRGQGRDDQWAQWDREDGYGEYGQYDDRIDSDRNGYDDRDDDRDGRWEDDGNGSYAQPTQRGGLGGFIDSIFGSNSGGSELRVGERAPSNLYGVPIEYRNQYRDGNGAYYRSDGRQIYQIDTRTHAVVRVFPMNR